MTRRDDAQIRYDAGAARLEGFEFEAAAAEFEAAIELEPTWAGPRLGLGMARRNLGDWPRAEAATRQALAADPELPGAWHYLGVLLVEQDRLAEALPLLEGAVARAPDIARHQRDLAVSRLFLGEVEAARQGLLATIALDVTQHEALYTLVRITDLGDGSARAAELFTIVKALAARPDALAPDLCIQVLFALGKAYDDRGDVEAAAQAFAAANTLKRTLVHYDADAAEARYAEIAEVFDAARIASLAGAGAASTRPIFVLGMPRSGTSLVEQILAAHPDVHGGGELPILGPMLAAAHGQDGAPYPAWARTMNEADCEAIGEAYLARLPVGGGKPRTTDKWLDNFEHLGLIAVALPGARVIHCRRDARDQLLSCWFLLFSQNQEYAYDLAELARQHRAYLRLMAHWRRVLPEGMMLEVSYEALIADPEGQTRRLLDHCALSWDAAALRFWESSRPVKSASVAQVREPIHDRSVGRWRAYEAPLRQFFETIAADHDP